MRIDMLHRNMMHTGKAVMTKTENLFPKGADLLTIERQANQLRAVTIANWVRAAFGGDRPARPRTAK